MSRPDDDDQSHRPVTASHGECRCHRCREATAAAGGHSQTGTTIEDWRQRLAKWAVRHGRAATYHNGCRCPRCQVAWRQHVEADRSHG